MPADIPTVGREPGEHEHDLLITGAFYSGAFGPSIILILRTQAACALLQDLCRRAAAGAARSLTDDSRVRVDGVAEIRLASRADGPGVALTRISDDEPPAFLWSATAAGWDRISGLLDPLCHGQHGHQYLTREGIDDALIEVSYGEQHGHG